MGSEGVYCAIGCGGIVFLTCMIMLITSFAYVEYDEYCFKKSTTTNKVDQSEVYANGRYLWGFNQKKVSFPRLFQLQELELSVSNEEGVAVTVDVSFWYRLPKDDLSEIYSRYGTSYETQIISFAKAAVRNTVVDFSINEFLQNRTAVRSAIAEAVETSLADLYVDCPAYTVQLNEIQLADLNINKLLAAAITLEEVELRKYEQEATEIRAETEKLVEEYTSNTTVITRTAEANKTQLIETAQAQYDEIVGSARGTGIADTMSALGIVDATDKARFLQLVAMLDNEGARIVDLDSSAIVNLG